MQSQQFQNVQEVIYSLRKAVTQRRQNILTIFLRMIYIYKDGLGNLYRSKIEVRSIPIPIQILREINIADYIFNYLSESYGIVFKPNVELLFVIEGNDVMIEQLKRKSSVIIKKLLEDRAKTKSITIIPLKIIDHIYINRICQALVINCDEQAKIKHRSPTGRSGNYQVNLYEVTLQLNPYVTAKALSYEYIPVGTGLYVIITGIHDSGRIEATQVYSKEDQKLSMFNSISIEQAEEMSLDKKYKDIPVGKMIPATVLHFQKITNFNWSMRPEIKPPKEFDEIHRQNIRRLKGDYELEIATSVYPPYYEYILELYDSKIILKGSCICNPILDQISSKIKKISIVNVKVKSISLIKSPNSHYDQRRVNIDFQIESF